MQKRLFFKNTLILTATSFLLRGIGIFFRIYLSNIIGAEGMGIYQLIFCIYTLMCVVVSAGFTSSSAKLAAAAPNFRLCVIKTCLKTSFFVSLICSVFFFVSAKSIAKICIGFVQAEDCIKILSCGLIFVSASACLKGYFTALRKASVCSNSQLFEQFIRMGIIFLLLPQTKNTDIYTSCKAVVFANAVSELAAFAFLYTAYKKESKNLSNFKNTYPIFKNFLSVFVPVSISSYTNSSLHTIENLIVPDALFKHTLNKTLSVSLFGMIKGMAIPVIFFPASLLNAVSTLLLPEISFMNENKNTNSIKKTLSCTIHLTLILSFGIGAMFFVCANDISYILYHNTEVGHFMRSLSLIIPFMYTESVTASTLCALNLQKASMRFNIYNSVIRIASILTFLPHFGIESFIIIMIASNIFTSTLNFIWLYRHTKFDISIKNFFAKPIICAIIATLCSTYFFSISNFPLIVFTAIRSVTILTVYVILLVIFKTINFKSIKFFHISEK